MAALIAGFYWRQALLQLSPFAAILYLAGSWRSRTLFPGHLVQEKLSRGAAILVVLALLIGVLPYLAAKPWGRYTNEPGMRDVMLRQAMIRQALLPPDDPYVTPNEQAYALALSQSIVDGRFYSGLREDLLGEISGPIFSKPMPTSVPSFFWTLVRRHPGRYAAGVGRTLLLFAGVKGLESENHISLTIILSPDLPDAKLGDGPPAIQRAIKDDFSQKTKPGAVLKLLWGLSSGYEALLLVASLVTFAGLIIGVIRREFWTVVLCGIPIMYMVLCALLLASIDRYAFPAYPLVIADCVLVPATWLRAYNSGEQKPANELAATLTDAT
ncbi:MAG: hypothetical protein C5B51_02985 [Terriglobia bacterium]|nr:MAG: hypothetical protein C5B51_02985 [Terriglobia bacterium]